MGYEPQSLQLGVWLKLLFARSMCVRQDLCVVWVGGTHSHSSDVDASQRKLLQGRKKTRPGGTLCATESSVGNLLKELFLQDQSESDKIFELCEWVKTIHATQRKLLPGRKKTSPGWDVCLKVFSWEFAQRTFDARSISEKQDLWVVWVVNPIHTPQMMMLAKGN